MTNTPPTDLKDRTFEYARRIIRLFSSLRGDALRSMLGKQVLRSGTSIGANYREAYRGRSKAVFVAKWGDCPAEAEEASYWLGLLNAEKIAPEERLTPMLNESRRLIAIFAASLRTAKTS